jgi:hypothetical protein
MPEVIDYKQLTTRFRENRGGLRAQSPVGRKVGQDIVFTRRNSSTITSSYERHTFWFLAAVTISFFIAQSLLILFGK